MPSSDAPVTVLSRSRVLLESAATCRASKGGNVGLEMVAAMVFSSSRVPTGRSTSTPEARVLVAIVDPRTVEFDAPLTIRP